MANILALPTHQQFSNMQGAGLRNGEAMNLKEGTRRLALLLGVVGAILGGFASYT